ncbi:MAG: hypothetical protein KJ922_02295, partial [Nanoarchaeota archaeon]|nr:hypothetical protein [Nanoarchaeota archaeon]
MKKKAQGLSLNVIIVAALALIVLIVLWAIFTGRMGATAKGLTTHQRCIDVCTSVGKDVGSTTDKLDPQATTAAASADH